MWNSVFINNHNAMLYKSGQTSDLVRCIKRISEDHNYAYKIAYNAWNDSKVFNYKWRAKELVDFINIKD